ncbi:hypothetical protein FGL89_08495 (plasmid) [Leuconostoc carnosum]|uniref:Transposase n=1 Tax=Leuconostoc carnosum TaxID=1252 RepID=A0AAE6M2J7_LEUCA|nr:hypothetical protein C4597_07365 [Weissella koreensis]QEA34220.1 hypothetical protein FGL89_08495 [Leuconostoc carnosum]QGN21083.1 hypothetical protein GKC51_07365 [Weissella koreensis]
MPQFASYLSSFQTDPSITYSERIKIETFCELGLSNIQMGVRINFTIYHKPTDFLILFYSSISGADPSSA